jgi:TPR repeat protein
VEQDYNEALKWYRLAADQDYPEAENNLGTMYESGRGIPQDDAVAVRWFRLAALHKNAKAETNLGLMYANGKGVTQDFAEARKWLQSAADHGEVKAQSNLGALYATGRGVPQSYVEAAKWYGLAAKRGDEAAGSILEKIRMVQARESAQPARLEEHSARLQIPSAPQQPLARIEPTMFRLSSPVMERHTISIGPPPSAGFHMMAGHFGRR